MLCIRKITFIDRAEPETLWTYNLKKQWCYGDLIAVRVHDASERVLGSTIPVPIAPAQAGQTEWGVSWMSEDPVESPQELTPAAHHCESSGSETPADQSHEAPASEALPTTEAQRNTSDAPPVPSQSASMAAEANEPAAPPPSQWTSGAPAIVTPSPTLSAQGEQQQPTIENQSVPASAEAPVVEGDMAATSGGLAPVDQPHISAGTSSPTATKPSASAAAGDAAAPPPLDSSSATGTAPLAAPISPSSPNELHPQQALPPQQPHVPSFSDCIPIDITRASLGPLTFDVINASGHKVAVATASVRGAQDAASAEPATKHFAVVVTPIRAKPKEKPDATVYAVLEFSVVVGAAEADAAVALAAAATSTTIPTPLAVGATCAFSTRTFYFPPTFLTGTGEYIVTNVLCVESCSDNPVRLEVALPQDLKRVGVLPDKKRVISRRGERAFFTFTWNVFEEYVATDAYESSDAEHESVGLHVLIRDGAENKAPMDIELIGGLPPADAEAVGPYALFVNHARVSNASLNAADISALDDILPISLVTRAAA